MEENIEVRNPDVPIETVFKWKQVECWKLRNRVQKLEATVKALRRNLDMVLKNKDLRRAIAKEAMMKERSKEINTLNQKLHNAYESVRELISTKLKLEDKLKQYEQDS